MTNEGGTNWNELLGALGIGVLGYALGSQNQAQWKPTIEGYERRIEHLRYFRIFKPLSLIRTVPQTLDLYSEAVQGYLLGLPNASVPMSARCLEIALTRRYEDAGCPSPQRQGLHNLIEWAGPFLDGKQDVAHAFRLVRNLLHETSLVQEPIALEALAHVTTIINLAFPLPPHGIRRYICASCGIEQESPVAISECWLGNRVNITCTSCGRLTALRVM